VSAGETARRHAERCRRTQQGRLDPAANWRARAIGEASKSPALKGGKYA
jgi:hypothetical protein